MNINKWKIRARVWAERLISKALDLPEFNCEDYSLQNEIQTFMRQNLRVNISRLTIIVELNPVWGLEEQHYPEDRIYPSEAKI